MRDQDSIQGRVDGNAVNGHDPNGHVGGDVNGVVGSRAEAKVNGSTNEVTSPPSATTNSTPSKPKLSELEQFVRDIRDMYSDVKNGGGSVRRRMHNGLSVGTTR